MTREKVELIPWDPENETQYKRMYDQRVACGWRIDEVEEWKQKQIRGVKVHYWIVSVPDFLLFLLPICLCIVAYVHIY